MIHVHNLTRDYSKGTLITKVLKGISFEIHKGQFVAITGRSGSGKSTLLYQLSLLDHPTSGEITIDDVNVVTLSSTERTRFRLFKLGYIFQDYALLPTLNAVENVVAPLLMQGISMAKAKQTAGEALEKVGLADRLYNLPSQLSGGQQQRVSIARAIAGKPTILFADEPTANLDVESSETILDIFTQLNKEGQTVIMVTHEAEFAHRADREIKLLDGVVTSDTQIKHTQ